MIPYAGGVSTFSHRFRSQAARWGAFANRGNAGSYSFPSQLVSLDSVEQPHVDAVIASAPAGRFKVLHLAAHEYTHWLDHVATLWGRRSLLTYYAALTARDRNNEYEFGPAIVAAWEDVGRIRSDSYYLVNGPRNVAAPWLSTTSCGVRFDIRGAPDESDPVPFIRYADPALANAPGDAGLIVRTPLSVVALTECTAQAAEHEWIRAEAGRLQGMTPADPERWRQALQSSLYDRSEAMYTAAFHCVANHAGISSVEEVLVYAPALATVALNLPAACYPRLRSAAGLHPSWYGRATAMQARRDPGGAFLAMLSHRVPAPGKRTEVWLDEVLTAAGIGPLAALEDAWERELRDQASTVVQHPRLAILMQAGQRWAEQRGVTGRTQPLVDMLNGSSALPVPEAILGDGATWSPNSQAFDHGGGLDAIGWFEAHYQLEAQMQELLVACRRA